MSILRLASPLFTSPRFSPVRRAAVVFFLFAAPAACQAGSSNPYVDVPGTGNAHQLDVTPSSGGRPVALGGAVDVSVTKSERWEHAVCTDSGCDSAQSCNDGMRAIPLEAEVTCDPADCTVEPHDKSFRVTPKHAGLLTVHAHARALDRSDTWDDTVTIEAAQPDGIDVLHDPLSDAGGVLHAVLPGAKVAWCAALYREKAGAHDTLYSATSLLTVDLPSFVTELESFNDGGAGSGASGGSYGGYGGYGSGSYGGYGGTAGYDDASRLCTTFRASAPGQGQVAVHAPNVRDRVLPFRVAATQEIVGAEIHALSTSPDDSSGQGGASAIYGEADVTYDPVAPQAFAEVTLHHEGEGESLAVVLRLRDGGTALGGASFLDLAPAWVASIAISSRLAPSDATPGVAPFLYVTPCSGQVEVPLADAGADAAPLGQGDGGSPADAAATPDGGADAAAPQANDAGSSGDPSPPGHVVYDCSPGTAHLRGEPFGARLDVPVRVPAWL